MKIGFFPSITFIFLFLSFISFSDAYCVWKNSDPASSYTIDETGYKSIEYTMATDTPVLSAMVFANCRKMNTLRGKLFLYVSWKQYIDVDLSCTTNRTLSLSVYDYPSLISKGNTIYFEFRISNIFGNVKLFIKL